MVAGVARGSDRRRAARLPRFWPSAAPKGCAAQRPPEDESKKGLPVALFLSTSLHKIDKKGRVSVPAAFREALADERFHGVILSPPLSDEPCIEGSGESRILRVASALEDMNPLSAERDALATAVLAAVKRAALDGDGRIVLPEELIAHAGLSGEALFAGLGEKFQIWEPQRFAERQAAARELARNSAERLPWAPGAKT